MAGNAARNAEPGKYAFANACRGVAALSVAVSHLALSFWLHPDNVRTVTGLPTQAADAPGFAELLGRVPVNLGAFGVALFFVVSGFVIPVSLERYTARAFLAGRLIRIWPTYWAGFALTLCALLVGARLLSGTPPFNAVQAGIHFFPPLRAFLYSKPIDGIVWTLEIEFLWYGLAAAVAPALRQGAKSVFLVPPLLFVTFLALWGFAEWRPPEWRKIAERLDFLLVYTPFLIFIFCGVALAFRQRGLLGRPATAALIILCVGLFLAANASGRFAGIIEPWSYLLGLLAFIAAMALQRLVPDTGLLNFLARISYPFYVVHGVAGFVLLDLLLAAGWPAEAAFGFAFALAIAISWALHVWVETPSHRFAQRVSRALSARPVRADGLGGGKARRSGA